MPFLKSPFRNARRVAVVLTLASAATSMLKGVTIISLGADSFAATGVSDDGKTVVGTKISGSSEEAFRWTSSGGLVGLGDLSGGSFTSRALDVSADGSVVVGYSFSSNGIEAFRWTNVGGMQGLGDLPGGAFGSNAEASSADGRTTVGYSQGVQRQAVRWDAVGNMHLVPTGELGGTAAGISADGTTVVGQRYNANLTREAFLWNASMGTQGLGDLPGGSFSSAAAAASADGGSVVGYGIDSMMKPVAFRWNSSDGMQSLGRLPDFQSSFASSVSGDGNIVVGLGFQEPSDNLQAFIWSATGGLMSLQSMLVGQGADLSGWRGLDTATDISTDGRWIVGSGRNLEGRQEAFLVDLGPRGAVPDGGHSSVLAALACVGLAALRRRLA